MSSALCKVYAQNTADSGLAFAVGGGKLNGGCLQRIPHLFSNLVSWKAFESVSLSFFYSFPLQVVMACMKRDYMHEPS